MQINQRDVRVDDVEATANPLDSVPVFMNFLKIF